MQCEEVREQFADYVIDQLKEPTATRVTDHLRSCENCRAEAEELKSLWTTLGLIPTQEPSPEVRSRFQIMLQAYEHGLAQAPRNSLLERFNAWLVSWWPRRPVLQLSLSLALLVLGVMIGRQGQSVSTVPKDQPNNEVAELRGELTQMRQMVALSLMQQQSASERLKGVNWSYQLQQPGGEVLTALLNTLMHDSNVNVRLATVEALRQFGDRPVVRRGVIEAMTRQESPMVQIALIDLAVDLREKESIATLRQLTQDQKVDYTVRDRAQKGIAELE
jgi:HEAT repeats/Putative zinc-finger